MTNELKSQFEEQLGLLETKVERAYAVSENKEKYIIIKKLQKMSNNVKEILLSNIMDNDSNTFEKIIDIVNEGLVDVIIHVITNARKQEKQETMYNITHLYSKAMEDIINDKDEIKDVCVAQARSCVNPISNAFNKVEKVYIENLQSFAKEVSKKEIDKVIYEIRKCANGIQVIHSEQTYSIENQITINIEKMVKALEIIKEKSVTESKHIRIKGGVTNSQNGKFTLSDIIAEKTEVVTDIPKRNTLQELWD